MREKKKDPVSVKGKPGTLLCRCNKQRCRSLHDHAQGAANPRHPVNEFHGDFLGSLIIIPVFGADYGINEKPPSKSKLFRAKEYMR